MKRSRLRWIGIAFVVFAILGSGLTLALRGEVNHDTIRIVDASSHATPLYGETTSEQTVGYSENLSGWQTSPASQFVKSQVRVGQNKLILSGSIYNVSSPAAVDIFKNMQINITSFPILETELNVTKGVSYGIRFFGQYSNGTLFNIWWEGSPLDHRVGKGLEDIRVNMLLQAFLATGRHVDSLTRLEIYIESRPNNPLDFALELHGLTFSTNLFAPITADQSYRAVYIDLGTTISTNESWSLYRIQLGVTVSADSNTIIDLHLIDGYTLFNSQITPNSYEYSQLTPSYDIAYYPHESEGIFGEMLPKSSVSMVIVSTTGSLKNVRLDYLDLIYLPSRENPPSLAQSTVGLLYVYFLFFLFLLPVGVALIVYHEFLKRASITRFSVGLVLGIGLVCRLALAPVTAHPFDMDVLLTSARGWFQYGTARVSQGPTLPVTFFLYWIPYSFYALLQKLGFNDFFLPSHDAGVLEAVCLKIFPISMDILMFSVLLLFKRTGKSLVWASFYFLNPLAIFTSSIIGHYDSAAMVLIIAGNIWLLNQKPLRAGIAFVLSGLLQLLGFISYILVLLNVILAKRYRLLLILAAFGLLALAYMPQWVLSYKLLLAISGLTTSTQFSAGHYTLLGSFGFSEFLSRLHLPVIVVCLVLAGVSIETVKQTLQASSALLYTCILTVALLVLLSLPSQWVWLVPIALLYATVAKKDNIGAFVLPFGAASCYALVSLVGSAYYLLGNNDQPIFSSVESVGNGLQVFTTMMTILGVLLLAYLKWSRNGPSETLIWSSLLVIGLYVMVYFWIGVYQP